MWVKPLVYSLLVLLDLMVLALIGTQLSSHKVASWNLLLPTLLFNLFGAYLLRIAQGKD
jgi:tryptophan-rich sensory protein